MDDWVLWLIAACAFAVAEIATTTLYIAPFSGGALVAAVVALLGGGLVPAGIVFLVVSVALLVGVRPIARRHLHTPAKLRTGTAALLGRDALVVETITDGTGAAKIDGEVWSARPFDEGRTIDAGQKVSVIEIRGATALVD